MFDEPPLQTIMIRKQTVLKIFSNFDFKREKLATLVELNNLGTTKDAAKVFGGLQKLVDAFYKIQELLNAS